MEFSLTRVGAEEQLPDGVRETAVDAAASFQAAKEGVVGRAAEEEEETEEAEVRRKGLDDVYHVYHEGDWSV